MGLIFILIVLVSVLQGQCQLCAYNIEFILLKSKWVIAIYL